MLQHFFPTAILNEMQLILASQMLPVAKKYLNDPNIAKNKWNYKTTFEYDSASGLANQPDIAPFNDFILKTGKKYLTDLGYDIRGVTFDTFIFTSEMYDGGSHDEHTHPNSILSGLLYLQVPGKSAPLIITDPRPFRQFVFLPKLGETSTNASEIIIHPKTGLFLMWESWIPHLVPRTHNTDAGRITLVFNISRKVA